MPPELSSLPPVDTSPVILEGNRVRLEPLTQQHLPELAQIAFEPSIWRWTSRRITTAAELETFFDIALAEIKAGTAVAWVTRSKATGKLAGSTRLYEISQQHRTMELGGTWLHPDYHRTGINVEAKYLQLTHAFERMNALRVSLKTHHENLKSQTAIAALGAKFEGVFRNHMIMPDGSIRHSHWYSIVCEDWPEVKTSLEARLARFSATRAADLPTR
jgi:RimJ/RimL family protein N-acetyltransferase